MLNDTKTKKGCQLPLFLLEINGHLDDGSHFAFRNFSTDDHPDNPVFIQKNDIGCVYFQTPGSSKRGVIIKQNNGVEFFRFTSGNRPDEDIGFPGGLAICDSDSLVGFVF